ncbi:scavenger receptor cysteine-rich type 1 protein M130 isoform X1 [Oreochromis niloticus]|uniref:scavenger receptor cysteine-rich type 1 protein M130 isoform X1 n=2 Tax=Oreochromis niloticus TaxID=8128 RepID=UPI0003945E65|nr:scavenger receptor cysteine-rich type 1 protein M130 isoform X1 [Oreochromis niloticus]
MWTQQTNFFLLATVSYVSAAADGQIRLAGSGSTRCSGRVEIYHNDSWGTVCDDDWDLNDAEVVCRLLNCGTALSATTKAHFGEGTGQIWLHFATCSGNENSLSECDRNGLPKQSCGHHEDAGVICSGPQLLLTDWSGPQGPDHVILVPVVLLLVMLVVCLVLWRRRRTRRSIQVQVAVTTICEFDGEEKEEQEMDENDYVNVEPVETESKCTEQAEGVEDETTDAHDYVEIEDKKESSDNENNYVKVTEPCADQAVNICGGQQIYQNL